MANGLSRFASPRRHVLVVGLVILFLVACGGSAQRSAVPVFGKRFSSKAIAVCGRVLAEKKAEPRFPFAAFNPTKPDRSKLPAIGRYESRGVQIFRSWLRRMRALGTPPLGQSAWTALLKPLEAHARIIADQQTAASRSDGA